MGVHWGRVTVFATGLALVVASASMLSRVAETGAWAVLGLAAVGVAVMVLPLASGVSRHARPLEPKLGRS